MSRFIGLEGRIAIIVDKAFWILLITVALLVIFRIGKSTLTRLIQKYSADKDNPQVTALLTIIRSIWKYLLLFVGIISVLNVFGMSITANSLLAAAGAGGLVVGIGAQDFIKDIVNGFTIIMENRYGVGDYIEVGDLCGTVVNISLRTTRIIGENEETMSLPNSSIDTVINYSKQETKVMCYLVIGDEKQLPEALKATEAMTKSFESEFAAGRAELMGVSNVYPYGIEIGVSCLCQIGHRLDLKFAINKAMSLALIEAGISLCSDNLSISAGENNGI